MPIKMFPIIGLTFKFFSNTTPAILNVTVSCFLIGTILPFAILLSNAGGVNSCRASGRVGTNFQRSFSEISS